MNSDNIVKGLLDKAWEDLKASRILYEYGLKAQALSHLEQASEKILKAYFIGYIVDFLAFIYKVAERASAYERYRGMHQLVKQGVKDYSVPKKLGHRFNAFLNKFLPNLYESMCGGEFADYYEYSIRHGLIPHVEEHRNKIINILMDEGLNREQAEKLLDIALEYLLQAPGTLRDSETREKICKSSGAKKFGHSLEELRRSKEPCLKATVQFYEIVLGAIEEYFEKEMMKNKAIVEDMEKAKKAFRRLAEYTNISLFEKYGENIDEFLHTIIQENMVVYMILPMHFCLVKYYEASRYPDQEITEDVLEKEYEVIPEAIKILEEVHGIVKELVSPYKLGSK